MLKAIIEKIEDAPLAYQGAYTKDEETGKFVLDVSKYDAIATAGIKIKNADLVKSEAAAKAELAKFDKFRTLADDDEFDATAYQEWKESQKTGGDKSKEGEQAVKFQEMLNKEKQKWDKSSTDKLTAKDTELRGVTDKYTNRVKRLALTQIALDAGVLKDVLDDVVELHMSRFKVADLEKGTLVLLDDGEESTFTPEHYFTNVLKESKPRYYPASDKGGSGGHGGNNNGGGRLKTIRASDQEAINANFADIASGKITVVE